MRPKSNSQRTRVSVVLIFLDEAPFLQEAIESVISQSFEMWELLLVDDGSTDGSTDIAKMRHSACHIKFIISSTSGMATVG